MIELRRLQVFMGVAETGSFTAAAARLYMSQPAVSQQINMLERELGEPLFVRTARGVRLNESGVFLRDRARRLLDQASSLQRDLQAQRDGLRRITIGAFPTAGIDLIPKAFRAILTEQPEIRFTLKQLDALDPISLLREQESDLVLMFEYDLAPRPRDQSFVYVEITNDTVCVLLPAGHPLADNDEVDLADLQDQSWVLRSHRAPYQRIYEHMFRQAGLTPADIFWTDDFQSVQGLVAAGVGVSLVPSLAIAQHRSDTVVRVLGYPRFARRLSLVASPEFVETAEYQTILSALQEAAEPRTQS